MHGHGSFLNSFPMLASSVLNIQEENLAKYLKYFSQEFNENILSQISSPLTFLCRYMEYSRFRFGALVWEGMNGRNSLLSSELGVLTGTALYPAYAAPHMLL